MTEALTKYIALISESEKVDSGEVALVCAALQKQVSRDLAPIWGLQATVSVFATLEDMPPGYWPMIVMDDIGYDAAGIHLDKDGQPFALISSDSDNDVWSLTASHECLEMLVDPFGDRLVAGDSPNPDQGRVMFLVEVCDPSEAAEFGYTCNGVLVSDFYAPSFFDPFAASGVRYSFTDAISEPRDVLPGGYLSWLDPQSDHWWQEVWFSGSKSQFRDLGPLTAANGSFRAQLDRLTEQDRQKALASGRRAARAAGLKAAVVHASSNARAVSLRTQIDVLVGRSRSADSGTMLVGRRRAVRSIRKEAGPQA